MSATDYCTPSIQSVTWIPQTCLFEHHYFPHIRNYWHSNKISGMCSHVCKVPAIWALNKVRDLKNRKGLEAQLMCLCKTLWWGSLGFTGFLTFLPTLCNSSSWLHRTIIIVNIASGAWRGRMLSNYVMGWSPPFPHYTQLGQGQEEGTYF